MASYNAPVWIWGFGEYTYPIRITYSYGRNIFTHSKDGGVVWDIAKKLAAVDVFTNTDFSVLTVSGSDKVTMDRKIDLWRAETDDRLEKLRGWSVF